MKLSDLHSIFLQELSVQLPEWRFVAGNRHFKCSVGPVNWLFHIAFVNHSADFDAVGDVAVEFLSSRKRVAIFGAQLGNIAGTGQTRHGVSSTEAAAVAAISLAAEFRDVGIPFLNRYSNPSAVLAALNEGGREALLISPLAQLHYEQKLALQQLVASPDRL